MVIGIGIAVAGFIGLVSFSHSIKTTFHESLDVISGIMVMQKGAVDTPFSFVDEDDSAKIAKVYGVKTVIPQITGVAREIDGKKISGISFTGMYSFLGEDPAKAEEENLLRQYLSEGRYLQEGDENAAVIGRKIAEDYNKRIGSTITVNGYRFRVVGIYSSGIDFMDSMIVIPIEKARKMAGLPKGTVNDFYVEVDDPKKAGAIAGIIEDLFPEYQASTSQDYAEEMGGVLSSIDMFFLAVAGIALAIGGIGVLNTMMMSVAERKKEFGVLRAVGWTDDDVMKMIIQESFFLGLLGGAAGMLLGYLALAGAAGVMPFKIVAEPTIFAEGLLLSVVLGVAGGLYPAWRASRLEPTIAMRD